LRILIFFSEKFDLFHVDFNDPDRKRTAKKSAEVYSQIIKSNKIPVELLSVEISQWRSDTVGSTEFNTFILSGLLWVNLLMWWLW